MAATSSPFETRSDECVVGQGEGIVRWIVSLEFGHPDRGSHLAFSDFNVLMDRLRYSNPSGAWHPDRYGIGVQIAAASASQAVQQAVAWHLQAVRAAGLDAAAPVRVEVHAAEGPQGSWENDRPVRPKEAPVACRYVCDELLVATRQLLGATTPWDVGDILDRFVTAVGGHVESGAPGLRTGSVDFDLSIDGAPAHHAVAPSFSVAALMMEQSLPTLLVDARRTILRLQ